MGASDPPDFGTYGILNYAICVCTNHIDNYILMLFIDTYMITVFTEISATHGLVCSRQNNSDMLRFELAMNIRISSLLP